MANKLVARLALMYGKPETENLPAWFAEMDRLVQTYSDKELDKAADLVMRSHRGNRFPSVSEMLAACEDARENMRPPFKPSPSKWPDWEPEAIERADDLIRCGLGKRAASEGWIFALHRFCCKHGRLPMDREIGSCIAEARGFDEAYRKNAESNNRTLRELNKLGDSIIRMRGYLGRIVDGEVRDIRELREYLRDPQEYRPPVKGAA